MLISAVIKKESITTLDAKEEVAKTAIATDYIYMKAILEKGVLLLYFRDIRYCFITTGII